MTEEDEEKPKTKAEEKKSLLEESKATAERLESVHAKLEKILPELERLRAEEILGGKSEAGQIPQKPKTIADMTPEEAIQEFEKGRLRLFD